MTAGAVDRIPARAHPPGPPDQPGTGAALPARALRTGLQQRRWNCRWPRSCRPSAPTSGSTRSPRRCSPVPGRGGLRRRGPRRARGPDPPDRVLPEQGQRPDQARPAAGGTLRRQVPATLAELVTLPGFGRKTANVVLGNAFDIPGMTVDTHFLRLSRRWRWTTNDRSGQGRGRRRGADPPQGMDDPVAPGDLARPPDVPRQAAGLRGVPDRQAVPVRRDR